MNQRYDVYVMGELFPSGVRQFCREMFPQWWEQGHNQQRTSQQCSVCLLNDFGFSIEKIHEGDLIRLVHIPAGVEFYPGL